MISITKIWDELISRCSLWYMTTPAKFEIIFRLIPSYNNENDVDIEISKFIKAQALSNSLSEDERQQNLFGLLILIHALKSMELDGRPCLFRPATLQECESAGLLNWIKREQYAFQYGFYETYGFRFTILFNDELETGTVLGFTRLDNLNEDINHSLREADARRIQQNI